MKITKNTRTPNVVELQLEGRLDTGTSPMLREAVQNITPEEGKNLVLDCSDLAYVSSAGLRELLICRKRYGAEGFRITNVSDDVEEILQVTGFAEMLTYTKKGESESQGYESMSFKELFETMAVKGGSKPALIDPTVSYTWDELAKASQIVAADLAAMGVKKGTHVGLCGANSPNWVITFFAIQKLGAISVLINYNLKAPELVALSKLSDVTHLCFGEMPVLKDGAEAFLGAIMSGDSPIRQVYNITRGVNFKNRLSEYDKAAGRFTAQVAADDAAVMIFTSGSTGLPKAALLSAYNMLIATGYCKSFSGSNSSDVSCLVLPLFHIFGMIAGLLTSVISESSIVFPTVFKPGALLDLIQEYHCTFLHAVPTIMLALANAPEFSPEKVKSVRCSILAGAPCTETQFRFLRSKFPDTRFFSCYGMSEMAPITVTLPGDTPEHIVTTVGKPLPGFQVKIAENGEIMVQGNTLMCCYYKLDADKQAIDEDGWLHTGDMGVFDEEGYLHITGRIKDLIIRGGENISPGEVADAISQSPDIADVKVLGIPDPLLGEAVVAALIMKPGCTFNEKEMRADLAGRLAKFKIPACFLVYDAFPLLANGKIDGLTLKQDVTQRVIELVVKAN